MTAETLPRVPAAPQHTVSSSPSVIEMERVGKLFGVRPVLRGVTFSLPPGATLALLGANGAGKTTLLRILATLAKPTTGTAYVAGYDVQRDAHEIRRLVGYVGHQPHVYEELTARENLLFFARMYGLRDGVERATRLLGRVGLSVKANERVRTFSRGQVQRLALARGILHDPAVLLLDEPDTGLDEAATTLLTELIHERARAGHTTVFTTHQLGQGLALSDTVLVLAQGRVAYVGASAAVTTDMIRDLVRQKAGWHR